MSKPLGYNSTQIALHWGTAALIIYQFVYHEGIEEAYEQALKIGIYAQSLGWASHAIPGIMVLLLVIWQLVLRLRRGAPDAPRRRACDFRAAVAYRPLGVLCADAGLANHGDAGMGRPD